MGATSNIESVILEKMIRIARAEQDLRVMLSDLWVETVQSSATAAQPAARWTLVSDGQAIGWRVFTHRKRVLTAAGKTEWQGKGATDRERRPWKPAPP